MTLSKIAQSTNEESQYVRNRLIEFNAEQVPNGRYEELNLCVKDDRGEIVAGLNSAICWNWLEIDILWVHPGCRGQGYGRRLLEEAEKIARGKDCSFIQLNTFSFQAPEFYKKFGYAILARIDNAPNHYQHYYLIKEL